MRSHLLMGLCCIPLLIGASGAVPPVPSAVYDLPPGRLRVSSNLIPFPMPGANDLDTGFVDSSQGFQLRINAVGNRSWELFLHSPDPDMGGGKPVGDLQWRIAGQTGWNSLGNANQLILQGARKDDVYMEFRVLVDWSDETGTYECDLVFELYVL